MKKIISAALVGTIIAAGAFADISVNYRTQAYGAVMTDVGKDSMKTYLLSQNTGTNSGESAYGAAADTFTVTIKSDRAGATVSLQPNADTALLGKDDGSQAVKAYNAYVNFFDGVFTINSGYWGDNLYRADRVTTDAGNWAGADFEANKLGITNGSIGKGIDSVVSVNNTAANTATFVDVKLPVAEGSTLLVRAAADSNKNFTTDSASSVISDSSYSGIIAFTMDKMFDVEAVAQFPTDQAMAFGLYASPLMVEGLKVTVGGAWGIDRATSNTEWGADLRARYAVDKNLSFTTMHNISCSQKGTKALWDMFNCKYKVNDGLAVQFNASLVNSDVSQWTAYTVRATPGVIINAGTGSITTGVAVEMKNLGTDNTVNVYVPVVLRVKMAQ